MIKNLYSLDDTNLPLHEMIKQLQQTDIETLAHQLAPSYVANRYFIAEKYDALVDSLFLKKLEGRALGQRGKAVSGGEKNKICLARFLLPETTGPFVIDEPFTSLDLLSEEICLSVLKQYTKERNGIIISHKMNVIENLADEILVMEQGFLSDRGSHIELMANDNLYRRLFLKHGNLKEE